MIKWVVLKIKNGEKTIVPETKDGTSCPVAERILRRLINSAKHLNNGVQFVCVPV